MTDAADVGCGCGCSTLTLVTNAAEPCSCGCKCCSEPPKTKEEEIAELRALQASVRQRLTELGEA